MSFDLTPINVKKADGTATPMLAYSDGTNNAFAHAAVDSTGAIISPATSGKQDTGNSALATIASNTAGLATASAQTTGNTSMATVATNTGNLNTNLGAQADTAATTDTGTFSAIALVKRGLQNWTTLLARVPALVSGRVPVDGSGVTQPVSAASLPLPTGAATAAAQATGNASLASIDGKLPTLDNSKITVIPAMTSGGNISVQTNATGTNWAAFGSQALKQLTVSNQSGATLEFRQGGGGVGFQIPTGGFYTFFGITNANQIEVHRTDNSNTQALVTARWES